MERLVAGVEDEDPGRVEVGERATGDLDAGLIRATRTGRVG